MKTCVIINPAAGSAGDAEAVERWAIGRDDVVVLESPDEVTCGRLVRRAVGEGAENVVAAGGDGTINLVLNALMEMGTEARLGILPLGTGNDLAHTLGVPRDVEGALEALDAGREERIDVFCLEAEDARRYGVNVAAGGFSGQVDEVLTSELKTTWGPLAYILGVVQVLPDLQQYETFVALDGQPRRRVQALNVVVANGRTAAGGRPVAPRANPCDGLLDVVLVKWGRPAALAEVGTRLVAGDYLKSPLVSYHRARHVAVTSMPGMWFNVDGELVTKRPVTIEVLPRRLRAIVGPAFDAAPPQA